ncbi:hypothetical protein SNEBB_010625, partial [Seison nebaliae]
MEKEEEDEIPMLVPIKLLPKKRDPVPVTIITGQLGAGKTTLLKEIIRNDHKLKIAILLNDFGTESVGERELLLGETKKDNILFDEWMSLKNGCICCSLKGEMVGAIEKLLMNSNYHFNHILIETSGLSNPIPIIKQLWMDDQLESLIELNGIVTVVDMKHFSLQFNQNKLFVEQLIFADIILLNKVDLVSTNQIELIKKTISQINSSFHYIVTRFSQLDELSSLFSISTYRNVSHKSNIEKIITYSESEEVSENSEISTLTLKLSQMKFEFNLTDIKNIVDLMLWETSNDFEIMRMKGLIHIKEDNQFKWYHLQSVAESYDIQPIVE